MKRFTNPVSRKDDIVVQELDGEVLIYDLRANKAFCLNETSALVWRGCDGTRDVTELSAFVAAAVKTKPNHDVVWLALDQLNREGLLEAATDTTERFKGMSRREVIRRIGLTSATALPVVLGMIAPRAAHANSLCVTGGSCLCSANSGNMQGQICAVAVPCADTNCRCAWENNGNMNGTCVP